MMRMTTARLLVPLVLSFCLSACSPPRPEPGVASSSPTPSDPTAAQSAPLAPEPSPETPTMTTVLGGYRYTFTRSGERLLRIDAERAAEPDTDPATWSPGPGLRVGIDPASGTVAVYGGGDRALWRGGISPIEAFGRAGVPGLEIAWDAAEGEALYGLGERFDALDQYGKQVDLWIVDAPGQGDRNELTYFTAPVLYSTAGYGLFAADNPESVFDLNASGDGRHRYQRPGDKVTFYVSLGATLKEQIADRMTVQGPVRGIPDWAWGPWISKNSYENQGEAEAAIRGNLERDLPVAAVVQEAWKGSSEKGQFNTFNTDYRWPELDRYLAWCEELGIKNILWQVPILHPASPHYKVAAEQGYFVKKPDGSISHREHWLKGFANLDFTNPDAVRFWQDLQRPLLSMPTIVGFKADDGEDIKPDDVFFDGRRGWEMHNEWSYLYNQALTDLLDQEGVDGMLWARSGSLGIERTPGLWAGDQWANWMDYRSLIPAGLSAGLSGAPFWSHDIGGYLETPTPELYIRWAQFGALSPLMQYHGVSPREPWLFGEEALAAYRTVAHLRMNLKPYLIKVGREAAATGLPVMRPMILEFPGDARFTSEDTQYMLGPDLLVAPVLEAGARSRTVKFPEGVWHHLSHRVAYAGPSEVEVPMALADVPGFLREGAEIPVQLDEDGELGRWHQDMPFRTLMVAPERSPIRNLEVTFSPDSRERLATVSFDADPKYATNLTVGWRLDRQNQPESVRPQSTGGPLWRSTWNAPPELDIGGHTQELTIAWSHDETREELVRATLAWSSPVTLRPPSFRDLILEGVAKYVVTELVNERDEPARFTVTVAATPGLQVAPPRREIALDGKQRMEVNWTVTPDPGNRIGDERIRWVVLGPEGEYTRAEAILPSPMTWVTVGPLVETSGTFAHAIAYAPEWSYDPHTVFRLADGEILRWTPLPRDHQHRLGCLNFTELYGEDAEHAAAYALTFIRSDRNQPVELRLGSDDGIKVWVNGEQVHAFMTNRPTLFGDDIVPTTLTNGVNTLLIKVAQNTGLWDASIHITGRDGRRVRGLTDGFESVAAYADADAAGRRTNHYRIPQLAWQVCGPIEGRPDLAPAGTWSWDRMANDTAWPPAGCPGDWQDVPPGDSLDNHLDLHTIFGARPDDTTAYAATTLTVNKPTPVELVAGSDDGLVVWLNGRRVIDADRPRGFVEGSDRVRVTLPPGRNRILARVTQWQGAWEFQLNAYDQTAWPPRPLGE